MGYTTRFDGHFNIWPPLSCTRMAAFGSQDWDTLPNNPGGHMQWTVAKDGMRLKWDEEEKFYGYAKWLQCIIDGWFTPRAHSVYGQVTWQGEDFADRGVLRVVNGRVQSLPHVDTKPGDSPEERLAYLVTFLKDTMTSIANDDGPDGRAFATLIAKTLANVGQ